MRKLLICNLLVVGTCALIAVPANSGAAQKQPVFVAWWNVENLFDTTDDPGVRDEEFTAGSDKQWTLTRLDKKLGLLSKVVLSMNDSTGPDILGLGEIENRGILERWNTGYLNNVYGVAHHQSPDQRGIDVALLYRKSVFQHVETNAHAVTLGGGSRPTRDVVVYTLVARGDTLDCVLVHWPSRYGGKLKSEPKRIAAAKVSAHVVDSLYKVRRNDDILVMGDFNDEPMDISITRYLRAEPQVSSRFSPDNSFLINAMARIDADPSSGTYYYRGDWNTLDQFLLSRGLMNPDGFVVAEPFADVFVRSYMREQSGRYKDAPLRTYVGPRYLGGISDHFPITLKLYQAK